MKKITIFLLLLISVFIISCYNTSNSNYIELKDVAIFDEDGNQVMGTIWQDYELGNVAPGLYMSGKGDRQSNIQKLNSAAPVSYVYTIDATLHSSLTINMKFNLKGSKKLIDIKLSNGLHSYYESYDLDFTITGPTEDDPTTTVSFKIDSVTAHNNCYALTGYTLLEKGNEVDYRYTVTGGSRHYRAIYLNLGEYYHLNDIINEFNRNFDSVFGLGEDVTNFDFSDYNLTEIEGKKVITLKEKSEYKLEYMAEYLTIKDKQILVITKISFNDPSIKIYNSGVNDDISVFDHPLRNYNYEVSREELTRIYIKEDITIKVSTTAVIVRDIEVSLNQYAD